MPKRWIIAWDFCKKPSNASYRLVLDELGSSHAGGDYEFETQTKRLPFRHGYGLDDVVCI